MIRIRRSHERGHSELGWLNAYQTFSFGNYHNPEYMGFRALRVLNDDRISPGRGFGPHAHRDMEIITYVVEGHVLHRDSMGEQHVVGPNEIQTMSAGSGIIHSEFNASDTELARVLQIWIEPTSEDLKPSYQQIAFAPAEKQGRLRLLAAPRGESSEPFTVINQDARFFAADVPSGQRIDYALAVERHAWLQVVTGNVSLNGESMTEGDGAGISGEREVSVSGAGPNGGEILLFDLA
jgi:redox-sensitive bicupin YhaK (pirin superfamily)